MGNESKYTYSLFTVNCSFFNNSIQAVKKNNASETGIGNILIKFQNNVIER